MQERKKELCKKKKKKKKNSKKRRYYLYVVRYLSEFPNGLSILSMDVNMTDTDRQFTQLHLTISITDI